MASSKTRNIAASSDFSRLSPEVVENILSFLPARSLANALLVCRLWNDISQRVLKRRKHWVCRLFEVVEVDEEQPPIWQDKLCKFLDNVHTVPSALIVSTNGLLDGENDFKSFLTRTQANLPVGCPILGCAACGIIGENSYGCTEELADNWRGLSVLLVPKVKGVNVHFFSFSVNEISKNRSNKQCWKNSFSKKAVKRDIKFVFLIGQADTHQNIGKVVVGIKKVFGNHVVVVGGLAQPFGMLNGKAKSNRVVVGLAIGGNVDANSVVHHGHSVQSLNGSFKRLHKGQPPERSACFMVSCVGRGEQFYGAQNVESSEFRKVFPKLKLFGLFGDGEIGANVPAEVEQSKESHYENFLHAYSTVFSVLTILDEEQ